MGEVFDFLKTHPSLFIIVATVIIIIVIYVFFTERRSKTSDDADPTNYIELQEVTTRSDQVDATASNISRPKSAISNRLRYDRLNNENIYENHQPRLAPVHEGQAGPSNETVHDNAVPLRKKEHAKDRSYNRVSVSDLHARSGYTSFGEFDDFDELNPNVYNENVMRLTVDFNAKDQNYVRSTAK